MPFSTEHRLGHGAGAGYGQRIRTPPGPRRDAPRRPERRQHVSDTTSAGHASQAARGAPTIWRDSNDRTGPCMDCGLPFRAELCPIVRTKKESITFGRTEISIVCLERDSSRMAMRRRLQTSPTVERALEQLDEFRVDVAERDEFLRLIRDYLEWVRKAPPLTKALEIALAKRAHDGDAGEEHTLVRYCVGPAISTAVAHAGCGLPLADLVEEAVSGVIGGVRRFDWKRADLRRCAFFWARAAVHRALGNRYAPQRFGDLAERVERAVDALQASGRSPTTTEIGRAARLPRYIVETVLAAGEPPASLNDSVDDRTGDMVRDEGNGETLAELLWAPDPTERVFSELARAALCDEVWAMARRLLPSLELRVIELRFGLHHHDRLGPAEIGRIMRLSTDRVLNLEKRALRRLHAHWRQDPAREAIQNDLALLSEGRASS